METGSRRRSLSLTSFSPLCSGQIMGNDLLEDVVSMAVTEVLDRKNIVSSSDRSQSPSPPFSAFGRH